MLTFFFSYVGSRIVQNVLVSRRPNPQIVTACLGVRMSIPIFSISFNQEFCRLKRLRFGKKLMQARKYFFHVNLEEMQSNCQGVTSNVILKISFSFRKLTTSNLKNKTHILFPLIYIVSECILIFFVSYRTIILSMPNIVNP